MKTKEEIVRNYIQAYNRFDVDGMVQNFATNIVFENIQDGKTTDSLFGKREFIDQAESAKEFFETREQDILKLEENGNILEIEIHYVATLAMDFLNTMKKGDKIELKGRSIFEFDNRNQIIKLQDIS